MKCQQRLLQAVDVHPSLNDENMRAHRLAEGEERVKPEGNQDGAGAQDP